MQMPQIGTFSYSRLYFKSTTSVVYVLPTSTYIGDLFMQQFIDGLDTCDSWIQILYEVKKSTRKNVTNF